MNLWDILFVYSFKRSENFKMLGNDRKKQVGIGMVDGAKEDGAKCVRW